MDLNFESYWDAIKPAARYDDRKLSAEIVWNSHPEKQAPIMAWLQKHGPYPDRNPYFFILDFTVRTNLTIPQWLRGDEGGDIVQVRYNGTYKLCTRETMRRFNLEYVRDW